MLTAELTAGFGPANLVVPCVYCHAGGCQSWPPRSRSMLSLSWLSLLWIPPAPGEMPTPAFASLLAPGYRHGTRTVPSKVASTLI